MISGTGNTAPGLTMATILLALWAFCSYIVRTWAKWRKTDMWGRDDTALTIALVAAMSQVAAVMFSIHRGYGVAWAKFSESDLSAVSKAQYAAQLLFVLSTGATRASAAAFCARVLTIDPRQQRIAHVVVGLCGLWTIGSMIGVAVRPPLMHPWTTTTSSPQIMYTRWLPIEIIGAILDIISVTISVSLVWQLRMSIIKRLAVGSILAVRLATFPVVACRLRAPSPKRDTPKRPDAAADVLTEAEMLLALILALAVCLKPFLSPFHPGWFIAKADGGIGLTGNHSQDHTRTGKTLHKFSGTDASAGSSRNTKTGKAMTSIKSIHDRSGTESEELEMIQPCQKAHIARDESQTYRVEGRAKPFASVSPLFDQYSADVEAHRRSDWEDDDPILRS